MQIRTWSAWRLIGAFTLVGLIAASSAAFAIQNRYLSSAVISVSDDRGMTPPYTDAGPRTQAVDDITTRLIGGPAFPNRPASALAEVILGAFGGAMIAVTARLFRGRRAPAQ